MTVRITCSSNAGQWQCLAKTDSVEAERVGHFVEHRPGLPRLVDSRLLFLARTRGGSWDRWSEWSYGDCSKTKREK